MSQTVVLGAGGMLGYAVRNYFSRRGDDVVTLSRAEFDIAADPIDKIQAAVAAADRVINCAGVIKPRIAEMSIEDVLRVNAIFPRNLAKLCARHGTRLYHVTTDCVYTGKDGGYDEDSFFDADDVYGLSKNAGDAADCMVLRTSIIGEEKGQSRSLLEWARSEAGNEINGFINHRWNGVTTVHLAEIIQTIEERGLYAPGIFHVHSPDTLNKAELVGVLSDVYELGLKIKPVDAATACDRSLSSKHSLSADVATKTIAQQVREMRQFFAAD
jgi:dTDP-4-dehydrorhamnose reductase